MCVGVGEYRARARDEVDVCACAEYGGDFGILPLLFLFLAFRKNEKTLGVE